MIILKLNLQQLNFMKKKWKRLYFSKMKVLKSIIISQMSQGEKNVQSDRGLNLVTLKGRVLYRLSYPAAWQIISPMVTKSEQWLTLKPFENLIRSLSYTLVTQNCSIISRKSVQFNLYHFLITIWFVLLYVEFFKKMLVFCFEIWKFL